MLQASVTLIEDGLTAGISDAELKMAYDMFSGFFAPTAPKSWAGFAGYYERQYADAFYILPSQGENYDPWNLSPVPSYATKALFGVE